MDLVDDIFGQDGLTAAPAARLWTLADDAFLEQMVDAPAALVDVWAGATPDVGAYAVETLDQARDRIDDLFADMDDGVLAFPARSGGLAFADLQAFADAPATPPAQADEPIVAANDAALVLPVVDDRLALTGATDDDFVVYPDDRTVLPGEGDPENDFYQARAHETGFQSWTLVMSDEGLYLPDHGHAWFAHDDWLF